MNLLHSVYKDFRFLVLQAFRQLITFDALDCSHTVRTSFGRLLRRRVIMHENEREYTFRIVGMKGGVRHG